MKQDDVVEAANTSRCTLASEALFMARHRLSKEGFGPDDPTIKAINDGIAALRSNRAAIEADEITALREKNEALERTLITQGEETAKATKYWMARVKELEWEVRQVKLTYDYANEIRQALKGDKQS